MSCERASLDRAYNMRVFFCLLFTTSVLPVQRDTVVPDTVMLGRVIDHVHTLGMAFFFTGNERYAKRAAQRLRVFFLDSRTGLRPSLQFVSMVPGVSNSSTTSVRTPLAPERLTTLL
jgi:hypothetical protein